MSFTYDPASARGRVRLHLADTEEASAVFQDEELDALLALASGDVYRASALGALALASDGARQARAIAAGSLSVSRERVAEHYREQARLFLSLSGARESSLAEDA